MSGPWPPWARRAGDALLAWSPAQAWAARHHRRRLTVLAYHDIADPETFARHLDWLVRRRHPVSLDEAADAVLGRRRLPEGAVLVTFDDGHRSVLEQGVPLLVERGVPAAVFVVAGLLDTDQPFWWSAVEELSAVGSSTDAVHGRELVRRLKLVPDAERRAVVADLETRAGRPSPHPQLRREELRVLESAGVAVGSHTVTHPLLPTCDDETLRREIEGARDVLTEALGHAPRSFAYPNGDRDQRVADAVRRAGHDVAFVFDHQLAPIPTPDPFAVSRVRMNSTSSPARLRTVVSGLHPALHQRRARP